MLSSGAFCSWQHFCSHGRWRQAMDDDEPDPKKKHILDRTKVEQLVCMVCDTEQDVGETCVNCGARATCAALAPH